MTLSQRQEHAEKEYREARKASRGRWRGGGFGLGGASKGAATAGSFNAVSGLGHDLVNSAGNLSSALDASNAKSDLYKSASTVLLNGLYEDMRTFFDNHIQLLTTAKPGYFNCFSTKNVPMHCLPTLNSCRINVLSFWNRHLNFAHGMKIYRDTFSVITPKTAVIFSVLRLTLASVFMIA